MDLPPSRRPQNCHHHSLHLSRLNRIDRIRSPLLSRVRQPPNPYRPYPPAYPPNHLSTFSKLMPRLKQPLPSPPPPPQHPPPLPPPPPRRFPPPPHRTALPRPRYRQPSLGHLREFHLSFVASFLHVAASGGSYALLSAWAFACGFCGAEGFGRLGGTGEVGGVGCFGGGAAVSGLWGGGGVEEGWRNRCDEEDCGEWAWSGCETRGR